MPPKRNQTHTQRWKESQGQLIPPPTQPPTEINVEQEPPIEVPQNTPEPRSIEPPTQSEERDRRPLPQSILQALQVSQPANGPPAWELLLVANRPTIVTEPPRAFSSAVRPLREFETEYFHAMKASLQKNLASMSGRSHHVLLSAINSSSLIKQAIKLNSKILVKSSNEV